MDGNISHRVFKVVIPEFCVTCCRGICVLYPIKYLHLLDCKHAHRDEAVKRAYFNAEQVYKNKRVCI